MSLSINNQTTSIRKHLGVRTIATVAGLTLAASALAGIGVSVHNSNSDGSTFVPAAVSAPATQEQLAAYSAQEIMEHGVFSASVPVALPAATSEQIAAYSAQEIMEHGVFSAGVPVALPAATSEQIATYAAQEAMEFGVYGQSATVALAEATPEMIAVFSAQELMQFGAY